MDVGGGVLGGIVVLEARRAVLSSLLLTPGLTPGLLLGRGRRVGDCAHGDRASAVGAHRAAGTDRDTRFASRTSAGGSRAGRGGRDVGAGEQHLSLVDICHLRLSRRVLFESDVLPLGVSPISTPNTRARSTEGASLEEISAFDLRARARPVVSPRRAGPCTLLSLQRIVETFSSSSGSARFLKLGMVLGVRMA